MKKFAFFFIIGWGLSLYGASDIPLTTQKLRKYCSSCHGLGDMRFIYSDSDEEMWDYILTHEAPRSKKLWIHAIYERLNWPNDTPPPFNTMMAPPDQDWMPKGQKRLQLANDFTSGTPTRQIMLETLREFLEVILSHPPEPEPIP